jgi:hypothetical protein
MSFFNRYSLWLGAAVVALLGAVIGAVWRPVAGALVALAGVAGFTAMWRALRTGPSTLSSLPQLREAVGAGKPVLVEVFSDT